MPTNLPPEYFEVEKEYRAAKTIDEKIATLEELISTIPKHKGTDHLRADLRRRLSKLKESSKAQKRTTKQESPFNIDPEGAGQVVLVGTPNVGKSALVRALTNATPEVADYPYTTWTPTPGMMPVDNVQIQLIDTPPLSEEFVEPQLLDLIRRADLVLIVIDLQTFPIQQLEDTLTILEANRILAPHREPLYEGGRKPYVKPTLVLANKCDDEACAEDFEVLAELLAEDGWMLIPVSAATGRNLEAMKREVLQALGVIRVYAKPPGKDPDLSAPFVLQQGSTVADFAGKVHQDFYRNLKAARVWGKGVYDGQMVGRDHVLHDGDIVELRL
ncbi:MAG: GTPase [Anaerolineae bacterium]